MEAAHEGQYPEVFASPERQSAYLSRLPSKFQPEEIHAALQQLITMQIKTNFAETTNVAPDPICSVQRLSLDRVLPVDLSIFALAEALRLPECIPIDPL
jgi:hypothetical protein